jgi:CheY-like chemotaxis protein
VDADAISALADLAWPVLAAGIILALLPTIKAVARSRAFKIKFGDAELSVEDASEQLRKQVDDLQDQVRRLLSGEESAAADSPPTIATETTPSRLLKRILWVDDKPENNAYEIAKLQKEGYDIQSVTSTQAALDVLKSRSDGPALIISDMSRREGFLIRRTAGLELIREVRAVGLKIPIYIYARGWRDADQVRSVGGDGITTSPIELMRLIDAAAAKSS